MLCSQMQMYINSHSNEVNAVLVGHFSATTNVQRAQSSIRSRSFTLLSHGRVPLHC